MTDHNGGGGGGGGFRHVTTYTTPVTATTYPVTVGSGGPGAYPGGDGVVILSYRFK